MDKIIIKGARENNLKNISLQIPKNKMVVITGVSGSGKSSLAFDTIYSEGQRRYVESLSSYARQFIGQMKKPELDSIEGLSPAISIEQKGVSKNPRSTVGTMTEIFDYMRLLFSNIGIAHCPICKQKVSRQSVDEIINDVEKKVNINDKLIVLSPVVIDKKGSFKNLFISLQKQGYQRIMVDDIVFDLEDEIEIDKNKRHNIYVIIDRIIIREKLSSRVYQAIEQAMKLSGGIVYIDINDNRYQYSENFSCVQHPNIVFPEIQPRLFSFNAPFGACDICNGLGSALVIDKDRFIIDSKKSIVDGGLYICGGSSKKSWTYKLFCDFLQANNIDFDKTYENLTPKQIDLIFYGSDKKFKFNINTNEYQFSGYKTFDGLLALAKKRHSDSMSEALREEIENKYMVEKICEKCNGDRLNDVVLGIKINDKNIIDITKLSIDQALEYFQNLDLNTKEKIIASEILKEIVNRLSFLKNVGLDYLTLSRATKTLSGGESQRIRLATQMGSKLTGVIYVLDEPSIGLHQSDNDKLIEALKNLKDLGNTLIIVEHDEDTMLNSDYIIDIGPGAGVNGGNIVEANNVDDFLKSEKSTTAKYLRKELVVSKRKKEKKFTEFIEIKNCTGNNLKDISVKFPKKALTVVTGVSGSGKSSLVNQTLYPAISNYLYNSKLIALPYKKIQGLEGIKKVIDIDQSPIGRTPRSNPATYTKIFDDIRDIFAKTNDAKMKGYEKGRFSFNVKGGRCETCNGDGLIKIEMNFLADVYVNCDVCYGSRYNKETLDVYYKGKNIAQVLQMSVNEAYEFFEKIPSLERKLKTLIDVGLGYISLGQSSVTLSGGEAQRIKLACELSRQSNADTIYILDEPTTGLHFDDVKMLLDVLNKLVEKGNTVIVIEHNLDVINNADYIIDIGPKGGQYGGNVIAKGTVRDIIKSKESLTGKYLKKMEDI